MVLLTYGRLLPIRLAISWVRRKISAQAREGPRFLDGVEIFAGEVLDQRDLQRGPIVEVTHHDGHGFETGFARRAQAPLPSDQLVARPVGSRARRFAARSAAR